MIIPFAPLPGSNFTFQPTLDGETYSATCWWNIYSSRWYITLADQFGNTIFTLPMIASPDNQNISIAAGYFTTMLIYRESTKNIEVI